MGIASRFFAFQRMIVATFFFVHKEQSKLLFFFLKKGIIIIWNYFIPKHIQNLDSSA